jgi:antitoxin (DNA-binding transcriptional repressor) of toxin-antitoxin stability system
MKKARIAELRGSLSRYLRYVRGGGTVVVLDRDVPIARLVPLEPPTGDDSAKSVRSGPRRDRNARPISLSTPEGDERRLTRLEHAGAVVRGKGNVLEWLRSRNAVSGIGGSVLQDLLIERETGW